MLLFFIQHVRPNSFIDSSGCLRYIPLILLSMSLSKYMPELSSVLNLSTPSGHAVGVKAVTSGLCLSHLVTTPRPTDGVDVYFEKPVDDTEHANFLRAKTDLEERRMKRINEVTFTGL